MTKPISEEINEIEPERWSEMVSKVGEYFDSSKTYSIDLDKHGQWGGYDIRCSAPSEKEVKELVLFALKIENNGEPPK